LVSHFTRQKKTTRQCVYFFEKCYAVFFRRHIKNNPIEANIAIVDGSETSLGGLGIVLVIFVVIDASLN